MCFSKEKLALKYANFYMAALNKPTADWLRRKKIIWNANSIVLFIAYQFLDNSDWQ